LVLHATNSSSNNVYGFVIVLGGFVGVGVGVGVGADIDVDADNDAFVISGAILSTLTLVLAFQESDALFKRRTTRITNGNRTLK